MMLNFFESDDDIDGIEAIPPVMSNFGGKSRIFSIPELVVRLGGVVIASAGIIFGVTLLIRGKLSYRY